MNESFCKVGEGRVHPICKLVSGLFFPQKDSNKTLFLLSGFAESGLRYGSDAHLCLSTWKVGTGKWRISSRSKDGKSFDFYKYNVTFFFSLKKMKSVDKIQYKLYL